LFRKEDIYRSLEIAKKERLFQTLKEIYSGIPKTTCKKCGYCCKESPKGYYIEFLNIYRSIKNKFWNYQKIIIKKSIEFGFMDIVTSKYQCPLLFDRKCLLYGVRPLSCRRYGLESEAEFNKNRLRIKEQIKGIKELYSERYCIDLPDEVIFVQPEKCKDITNRSNISYDDRKWDLLQLKILHLDSIFFSTTLMEKEFNYNDFSRYLCATIFGFERFLDLRLQATREFVEKERSDVLIKAIEEGLNFSF
jgi:Fe-S-cluster containining protein